MEVGLNVLKMTIRQGYLNLLKDGWVNDLMIGCTIAMFCQF